jgi:hypothetical protein
MTAAPAEMRTGADRAWNYFRENLPIISLFVASITVLVLMWAFERMEIKYTISLLVAVINILGFRFIKFTDDIKTEINSLRDDPRSNSPDVEIIDEQKFYRYMMSAITTAERTVDVTRLDPINPRDASEDIKQYYEMALAVTRNRRVKFRRIVRIVNADVLEWVIELLEELKDCRNFSIASLAEDDTSTLSLQIFDHKELLFLQLDSAEARHGSISMRITIDKLAEQFSIYYNKVWNADSVRIKDANIVYWNNLIGFAQRLLAAGRQCGNTVEVERLETLHKKLNALSGRDDQYRAATESSGNGQAA